MWNNIVVAGLQDGKPFLGTVTMLGVHYSDEHIATGQLQICNLLGYVLLPMPSTLLLICHSPDFGRQHIALFPCLASKMLWAASFEL